MTNRMLRSKIDDYHYEEILKKKIPQIAEKDPLKVTQLLTAKLRKAVFLYRKSHDVKEGDDDGSYHWRPAIEEHVNNWDLPDVKSQLVRALRNTLEIAGKKNIEILKQSLAILSNENYAIFRRLELHIYRLYPNYFKNEIETKVIDYFDRFEFKHEYYLLLQVAFPILNKPIQEKILSLIERGPLPDKFRETKEEFEIYKRRWKSDKLEPILEYLPQEKQKEYNDIVKQLGKSELSNFVVTHSAFQEVIPHTELSDIMTIDEVLSYVKQHKIEDELPEDDGDARKFKDLVENNSLSYSQKASKLLSAHLIFSGRFFWGLVDALKKKNNIDWENTILLAEKILEKTYEKEEQRMLDNVLGHLADLLEAGLLHDKLSIPFKERSRVWSILEKIVANVKADSVWENDYPNRDYDSYTISINSSLGRAMHAVMQYTVWCYHGLKKEGKILTELVPEAKTLLTRHLDPKYDKTVATHAVFGFHFSNLLLIDKEWTRKNIPNIFKNGEFKKLGNAAWESYLLQRLYGNVFKELKSEYEKRINRLKTLEDFEKLALNPRKKIAEHVASLYLSKIEGSDSLFDLFLKKAPPELIEHCFETMGRILEKIKEEKSEPKRDLKQVWSRKEIKSHPQAGWFFVYSPFDKKYNITMLNETLTETKGLIQPIYRVPEELINYASEYPLETLSCFEKMISAYQKSWELYHMEKEMIKTIKIVKQGNDQKAKNKADDIINLMGQIGYEKFRDLL